MKNQTTLKKKGGFTLPEVIVTITLIASLAAVVVPAVANQLKKGDPSRVASDAQAIRGGVEQFLTDVRRYPLSIAQLTNAIRPTHTPLTQTFPTGLTYVTGDTVRWKGPYITKDSVGALPTGFGWSFTNKFTVDTLGSSGASTQAIASGGVRYMTLRVLVPFANQKADALLLDQLYDDGDITTGSMRVASGSLASGSDTLKIILLPIS